MPKTGERRSYRPGIFTRLPSVAAAAELVGRLEARYDDVNATLDAELAALKASWPDRRRAVADAFSAGEAARAEAATKGKKAVVAALKAVKASK